MDVKLVVQTGEREGQEIPIDRDEFVIGRDRSCQLRIVHHQVSPRHCRITRDGPLVSVEALEGTNRTAVNGRFIDTAEVRHGDRLNVGSESFLIAIADDDDEPDDSTAQVGFRSVDGGWGKLRVIESRGIAVVCFVNIALINELEIREVDRELRILIEMGHNRIALNFDKVVRLSSQVIGLVLNTYRRCTADGGMLKICRIHPDLREIFALTGVFLAIDIYPDVKTALESDWPEPSRRRPAPALPPAPPRKNGRAVVPPRRVEGEDAGPAASAAATDDLVPAIPLEDVFVSPPGGTAPSPRPSSETRPATPRDNERDPIHPGHGEQGDVRPTPTIVPRDLLDFAIPFDDHPALLPEPAAPAARPLPEARPAMPDPNGRNGTHPGHGARPEVPQAPAVVAHARANEPPSRPGGAAPRVRLIVQVGRAQGQAVAIPAPRFLIGRDLSCHLRALSPLVSRFHALIEQRGHQVFLRDLGSSHGTILGDRTLRSHEEVEVADGQRLRIGPMKFTFAVEPVAVVAPISPARSGPMGSAPLGVLCRDPHLNPLIHCPHCGTDGWLSIDQLLLAIARALSLSPATASPTSLASLLHASAPLGHAAPAPGEGMPSALRNGHVVTGTHAGHAVPRVPTATSGIANGWGHGPKGVPVGDAVPHAFPPHGDGIAAVPSAPRGRIATPAVEVPAPPPEDEEPEFPDVLDLLPFEAAAAPTEEREIRSLPAPPAPRSMDIDFLCPECGKQGWIPVDRLDEQFQCQACRAQLYTDSSGGLLVGDISERPRSPNAFEDSEEPDFLGRAIQRWKALPRPVQVPLAGVAALLLCALIGWFLSAPALPATLKDRAIFVANAFAREDYRRLRAIAAPGSSSAVTKWMDQVRPRFWKGKIQRVAVRVNIQQQDKKAGKAALVAHVIAVTGVSQAGALKRPAAPTLEISSGRAANPPPPAAAPDNRKIDLKLYWVNRDGQWLLDGAKTAAAAQPSKPAEVSAEPPQPARPSRLSRRDLE